MSTPKYLMTYVKTQLKWNNTPEVVDETSFLAFLEGYLEISKAYYYQYPEVLLNREKMASTPRLEVFAAMGEAKRLQKEEIKEKKLLARKYFFMYDVKKRLVRQKNVLPLQAEK
jgi:hypothetical protein